MGPCAGCLIMCVSTTLCTPSRRRVNQILAAVGASVYHGFLPELLRKCAQALLLPEMPDDLPVEFATSAFMLIQLLCNYEAACEAFLTSGTIASLLPLISKPITHVKFSIRCARILEMILNLTRRATAVYTELRAVEMFIERLSLDVEGSMPEFRASMIGTVTADKVVVKQVVGDLVADAANRLGELSTDPGEKSVAGSKEEPIEKNENAAPSTISTENVAQPSHPVCPAEKKSLLKILLKFLLGVVQEPVFATALRSVVEGTFPRTLELIIRNPNYFGTTLWSSATKWITDFCNNEPSLLTVLQDAGVQDAIFEVLSTQIPASAEVLAELPNLLAAMSLNERGLAAFEKYSTLSCVMQVFSSSKCVERLSNICLRSCGATRAVKAIGRSRKARARMRCKRHSNEADVHGPKGVNQPHRMLTSCCPLGTFRTLARALPSCWGVLWTSCCGTNPRCGQPVLRQWSSSWSG